jgi:hypothetical protein
MKHLLANLGIALALITGASAAPGVNCMSRVVVNMTDNWPAITRTEPKVTFKIKDDLRDTLASINNSDRDDKIRALLNKASEAASAVLGRPTNGDIEGAVDMAYNGAVKTIAFIERGAKDPNSKNILESKKGQVTMAIGQVVAAHIACAE